MWSITWILILFFLLFVSFSGKLGSEQIRGKRQAESGGILSPSDVDWFEYTLKKQADICRWHPTCPMLDRSNVSSCCGSCTCDELCIERGTCCLGVFRSFAQARTALKRARYSCVLSQFLSTEESDFNTDEAFWMVTKCNSNYTNTDDINRCENPGSTIETIVPVTDLLTNTNYRNRYCAYCNSVDKFKPLINWNLQVKNKESIVFPETNLLNYLRATRGNVFYLPVEYITSESCKPLPSFKIDSCKKNGQWAQRGNEISSVMWKRITESIIAACESFIDPFNNTYKNYYCFICNDGEYKNLTYDCQEQVYKTETIAKFFSAIVDLQILTREKSKRQLQCDNLQFKDEKMSTCKDVACHEHGVLMNGRCKITYVDIGATCYTLFIKLTPAKQATGRSNLIANILNFTQEIKDKFKISNYLVPPPDETHQNFVLFYKVDSSGNIDYIVVYIISVFKLSSEKSVYLQALISEPSVTLRENYTSFSAELGVYNISLLSDASKLFVPTVPNMPVDELSSANYASEAAICLDKPIIPMNKLHQCPYVKLNVNEIPMIIEHDFLIFIDNYSDNRILRILSRWEYKHNNDDVFICLEDYLRLYPVLPEVHSNGKNFGNTLIRKSYIGNLILFILAN